MIDQRHLLLLLDPGLGKTAIALTAFEELRSGLEVDRLLVVAPLAVCYNVWRQEAAKWDHLRHLSFGLVHGRRKAEVANERHDVYLINPEGVPWLAANWRDLPDALVIDESTKFKRPGTTRFRALRRILGRFRRRYAMTGTPTPNGLIDLFGQAYCVDQGATFGRSMTAYKSEFFIPVPRGQYHDWVPRRNAERDVYQRLGLLALRLAGSELDMPELVVCDVHVELPDDARELYDRLRREMVADLDQGGELVALNPGALTVKCRQIANGRIYLDELPGADAPARPDGQAGGRGFARVHEAKVEALGRLVEELGGKSALLSYEFQHDLDVIRRAVGVDVPVLRGTDHELVTRWNRGQLRFMAAHPRSCGHGLNLQEGGSVLIMLAPPWDLELYQQMIGRLRRQGQRSGRVLVYRLVASETVDQVAAATLERKDATQRSLLDALREDVRDE